MNNPSDLKDHSAGRYVGQLIGRKEDRRLLTGRGRFTDDIAVQGMLHATFVRSQVPKGKIKSINVEAARAVPGVVAVFTGADINGVVKSTRPIMWPPEPMKYPRLMALADQDVRFTGDAVALVVAEDRYIAEDAAELIEVDIESEEPLIDYLQAETGPIVHPEIGSNVVIAGGSPADAELDAIFKNAPNVVEETFYQQTQLPMPMETRALVATFAEDELTCHYTTQAPHLAAWRFADAFGLARNRVRVVAYDVGGGFGLKIHPNREEYAVIAAAKVLNRPVKWIEDRMEHMVSCNHARTESATVKMAFDKEGKILAAHLDYKSNTGAYAWTATSGPKICETFPGPYKIPKYGFKHAAYYTNTTGRGAYRGPWMFETVSREAFMDVAAKQLGIDPVELRRRNVFHTEDQPFKSAGGVTYDAVSPDQTLEQAAKAIDIPAFRARQAAARKEGRYLGLGLALYMEPTAPPMVFMAHNYCQVRIEPSGDVTVITHAHSQGQGTETTLAQIVAQELGVAFEKVRVLQGDSAQGGFGMGSGGSRQGVTGGGAAIVAAQRMRAKVMKIAAHLLEAAEGDLTIDNGVVSVGGVPNMSITIEKIAQTAYMAATALPPGMEPGLEEQGRYTVKDTTWANASHACIVDVDIDTGLVKIERWVVSEDCGVMINPGVVQGQISGGIVQAIGGVLLEHAMYDDRGNPLAATMKDYLMPLANDVPVIEFFPIHTPSKSLGGFKGVGEGGAIVGPPTLMNAIADALSPFNVQCNHLPLSPSRLLEGVAAFKG